MLAAAASRARAAAARPLARRASTISKVHAREIIDSRGNPTVEVDVTTTDGLFRASCPSGASTGMWEAVELRDGGARYLGKGVQQAVDGVNNTLGPALLGKNPADQQGLDDLMLGLDGTPNKATLGANAVLGASLAISKAGAAAHKIPLYAHYAQLAGNDSAEFTMPVPCFNVINGGEHAGNKLAFQEFFIIPTGAETFKEAMQVRALRCFCYYCCRRRCFFRCSCASHHGLRIAAPYFLLPTTRSP